MIRLIISGVNGRMGRRISACAQEDERFTIVGEIGSHSPPNPASSGGPNADVVIDFSHPKATLKIAQVAISQESALIVGTTGLADDALDSLDAAAVHIPVMVAPNMSRGVAVMNHLVARAAQLLGADFDIDLVEIHHAKKKDLPSGTALRLLESIQANTLRPIEADRVHALRCGTVTGDHTVNFSGPDERLVITHSAGSRDVFARGALTAAAWISGRPPGRYTIEDALGLTSQAR